MCGTAICQTITHPYAYVPFIALFFISAFIAAIVGGVIYTVNYHKHPTPHYQSPAPHYRKPPPPPQDRRLFLGDVVHFYDEQDPAEGPAPHYQKAPAPPHHRKLLLEGVTVTISSIAPPPAEVETATKKAEVTGEEMQTVQADGLKKEDLNTAEATLAGILGQLGAHFNMDSSHRKAEVKVNKMMEKAEGPDTGKHTDNEGDNDTNYA